MEGPAARAAREGGGDSRRPLDGESAQGARPGLPLPEIGYTYATGMVTTVRGWTAFGWIASTDFQPVNGAVAGGESFLSAA